MQFTVFVVLKNATPFVCCYIYKHLRGAFDVARFDKRGNAKAYESWNG